MSELTAGRELDKLIAERIFGIKKVFRPCDTKTVNDDYFGGAEDYHYIPSGKPPRTHMIDARPSPHFSTDIAAAWQVVEKMQRDGNMVSVNASSESGLWWCCIYPFTGVFTETETVESAPLAICLAALKAIDGKSGTAGD